MQKKAAKAIERPAYLVESVDNALKLLQMLRDVGALRLKDAAQELGIAPSTAHRLFGVLLYRGFAVQDERRRYHPGPAMGVGPAQRGWTRDFNDVCRPHLETLAIHCRETVNLVIRVGTQVRFLSTVESTAILRVGDRQGQVLPAELTSGGRILLAEVSEDILEQLYLLPPGQDAVAEESVGRHLSPERFAAFRGELAGARRAGYALNVERTEEGVAAFGVAVHNRAGRALGAVSVAVPITRFHRHSRGELVAQIKRAVQEMEVEVAGIDP